MSARSSTRCAKSRSPNAPWSSSRATTARGSRIASTVGAPDSSVTGRGRRGKAGCVCPGSSGGPTRSSRGWCRTSGRRRTSSRQSWPWLAARFRPTAPSMASIYRRCCSAGVRVRATLWRSIAGVSCTRSATDSTRPTSSPRGATAAVPNEPRTIHRYCSIWGTTPGRTMTWLPTAPTSWLTSSPPLTRTAPR